MHMSGPGASPGPLIGAGLTGTGAWPHALSSESGAGHAGCGQIARAKVFYRSGNGAERRNAAAREEPTRSDVAVDRRTAWRSRHCARCRRRRRHSQPRALWAQHRRQLCANCRCAASGRTERASADWWQRWAPCSYRTASQRKRRKRIGLIRKSSRPLSEKIMPRSSGVIYRTADRSVPDSRWRADWFRWPCRPPPSTRRTSAPSCRPCGPPRRGWRCNSRNRW
jgi:hypothetical protein